MPDDVKTETQQTQETTETATETATETQVTETQTQETEQPHPLDPGGKRFNEVYRDMQDARREAEQARREAMDMRDRVARLEGAQRQTQQPQKFYTPQQLQAAVDAGQISPALMADQLAWQRTEMARVQERQQRDVEQRQQSALSEVYQYVEKMPELRNQTSDEFRRVSTTAAEIASELGRSIEDPIVQRRALRETFGTLDKVAKVKETREVARQNADTHSETHGGGGRTTTGAAKDPLKNVPQMYKDHWKRLGYTQEQMVEESKYIKPRRAR